MQDVTARAMCKRIIVEGKNAEEVGVDAQVEVLDKIASVVLLVAVKE